MRDNSSLVSSLNFTISVMKDTVYICPRAYVLHGTWNRPLYFLRRRIGSLLHVRVNYPKMPIRKIPVTRKTRIKARKVGPSKPNFETTLPRTRRTFHSSKLSEFRRFTADSTWEDLYLPQAMSTHNTTSLSLGSIF